RRWLRGYHFGLRGALPTFSAPIIVGELPVIDDVIALSFLDLQEARCLEEFRKRGVGWKMLRDMHLKARAALRTDHPFSTGQFKTVGRRIMRDFATETGDAILLDLAKDQASFRELLQPYLRGLEFLPNSAFPARWYPMAGTKRVVIDPRRSFGHPIVAKR